MSSPCENSCRPATAPLTLLDPGQDTPSITLGTVLPGAAAAITRSDGSVLLGLQVQTHSGDLNRDLATALEWALAAQPSSVLSVVGRATAGRRLAELIVDAPLDVTVHDDFGWWLETEAEAGSEVASSLERANTAIMPTARLGRAARRLLGGRRREGPPAVGAGRGRRCSDGGPGPAGRGG